MIASLADALNAWSMDPGKIAGRAPPAEARRVLAAHRARLRQAERFVLDDEAVRVVCRLSHEVDRLPGWAFLARLPYPVVWFEMSLHAKVREWEAMGTLGAPFRPEEVSPRVGYLMYHDGNSPTRWIAHEFQILNGAPVPALIAIAFDPEGDGDVVGSATWGAPTLSRLPGFGPLPARVTMSDGSAIELTVDAEFVLGGDLRAPGPEGGGLIAPGWFASRCAAIQEPFWAKVLERRQDHLNESIRLEVNERKGVARWLVTMLAAINGLPKGYSEVAVASRRMPGVRKVAPLGLRTLTIELPRDDRVARARRLLERAAGAARKRWHPVIGHWMVIEWGKAKGRVCRHEPAMVEVGVGMCSRCGLMIRWREVPNGRGDPALGMVERAHRVTGKLHHRGMAG